jgi:hypothetical protein
MSISVIPAHLSERDPIVLIGRKSGLIHDGKTRSEHKSIGREEAVVPGGVCGRFWQVADNVDCTLK